MTSLDFQQASFKGQTVSSSIPGKLFIMGEYAILQAKQAAILMAVDQYLTCQIQPLVANNDPSIESYIQTDLAGMEDLRIDRNQLDQLEFTSPSLSQWRLVIETYKLVDHFLQELGLSLYPSQINFQSDLQAKDGAKYGFGSSGAVVVSLIKALFDFHCLTFADSKELVFKLASLASFKAGSNGSMADIASICHGGWIYYRAFNRDWVRDQLEADRQLLDLVAADWPDLLIEPLPIPDKIQTVIGWTGKPASTQNLVALLKNQLLDQPQAYQTFLDKVSNLVDQAKEAILDQDWLGFKSAILANRQALHDLGAAYQLPIETKPLKVLADLAIQAGGVGKLSGAGGGDCGLAFAQNQDQIASISQAWLDSGIQPLRFQTAKPINPLP